MKRGAIRKCKHCNRPARRNVNAAGRNKGWLKTCGDDGCLTAHHKDPEVSKSKRVSPKKLFCELCSGSFTRRSRTHKWCDRCVPDKRWRHLARRYGIGMICWDKILAKQNGTCALCENEPKVVDHDHVTGENRGLLCISCNLLLAGLDADSGWIKKAIKYRNKQNAVSLESTKKVHVCC